MLVTYRVLAYAVAVLVGAQAAFHAWSSSGLGLFVAQGGVVDKAFMENTGGELPFPEIAGFMLHGMNGMVVIPVVALALLVVSFFTKARGLSIRAAIVLGLVALQVFLGLAGHSLSLAAMAHGFNALVLFAAALVAAHAATKAIRGHRSDTETPRFVQV